MADPIGGRQPSRRRGPSGGGGRATRSTVDAFLAARTATESPMPEEPIVNSAEDAVRAFVSAELDLLIAGKIFVTFANGAETQVTDSAGTGA